MMEADIEVNSGMDKDRVESFVMMMGVMVDKEVDKEADE